MVLYSWVIHEEESLVRWLSHATIISGIGVVCLLQFFTAPYGRYARPGWGKPLNARVAWFLQELPAFTVPLVIMAISPKTTLESNATSKLLLGLYLVHYFQRCFIYPMLIQGGKPTALATFLSAIAFCALNSYMQTVQLLKLSDYSQAENARPRLLAGISLFIGGLFINIHADHILRSLRKPGDVGYKIPRGGMFEYVSGANFFGEIVEWWGFALAGWSLPALAFAVFTTCNLLPRAQSHHQWYKEKFDDYPKQRKALIPFVL